MSQLNWAKLSQVWEVVVAQLVEQLLSISEVRGSTPVFGKIYIEHLFVYYQLYWKDENIKEKWPTFLKNVKPSGISTMWLNKNQHYDHFFITTTP